MNDSDDEEGLPDVKPDDAEEQLLYLHRLRGRYPAETARVDEAQLSAAVREGLQQCLAYQVRSPGEVLRLLALDMLITPEQKKSKFLTAVSRSILSDTMHLSRKRLDFIYKHIVRRPAPNPEPDFGPWFVEPHPPV